MKNNIYLFFFFCLLPGCAFNNPLPIEVYTLSPKWEEAPITPTSIEKSLTIKIATIRASQALTGNEILYTNKAFTQNSYLYSHWNDSPVKLLQIVFQNALEKNHLYKATLPPTSIAKTDLVLESTLLELNHYIDGNKKSYGVIRIHFYLVNNINKTIIATKELVSTVPANTQSAKDAVKALNKAARKISQQLIDWLEPL